MRSARYLVVSTFAVIALACADDPAGPPSGVAGAAGSAGAPGSAGAAGAPQPFLSGKAGVHVVASRGIRCQGSCGTTMSGPFLTNAGQLVVGGSLSGRYLTLDETTHDTGAQRYDGYFGLLAPSDLAVSAQRVFAGPASTPALRVTAAGDAVIVAGPVSGPLDLGAEAPLPAGEDAGFLAGYDPGGSLRFARIVPAFSGGVIAGHRSGSFALGLYAPGTVDFGCGAIASPLGSSLVLVFDAAGACVRQRVLGGFTNTTVIDALAFGTEPDDVAIAGRFHDTLTFGERTLTHQGEAAFLGDFLIDGEVRWLRKVETPGAAPQLAMVRDAFGSFVVTTMAAAPIDLAFGPKPAESAAPGTARAHVARYDYEGLPLWHVALPPTTILDITPAVSASGYVYVGGSFAGTLDLGDGPHTSAGRRDAWLARLENGGAVRWSVRWGTAYDETVDALAAGENGLFVRASPPPAADDASPATTSVGISHLTLP